MGVRKEPHIPTTLTLEKLFTLQTEQMVKWFEVQSGPFRKQKKVLARVGKQTTNPFVQSTA